MARAITGDMDDAVIDALFERASKIADEWDAVERQIKELLEQGKDGEALTLMRKHLNVAASKRRGKNPKKQ